LQPLDGVVVKTFFRIEDVMKITKLPPGEAEGARDLQTWASRRSTGWSGVPLNRKDFKQRQWKRRDRAQRYLDAVDKKRGP
jgi:hypothetical protein